MTDWLQLIRSEYQEIPGLQLTRAQAQRFWNLDAAICDALLHALETNGFLRCMRMAFVPARRSRREVMLRERELASTACCADTSEPRAALASHPRHRGSIHVSAPWQVALVTEGVLTVAVL